MERKVKFSTNEYYHLYSRGVDRRKIFLDKNDYDRFMSILYIMNQPDPYHFTNFLKAHKIYEIYQEERKSSLVDILAYTLMSNHFHILAYEKKENGISKFMMRLLTAYSMYFNKKYERSGPLFMHPFRSQHISKESQYLWIFSYIHLNPVKIIQPDFKEKGIKNIKNCEKFLLSYKYSSYHEYLGHRRPESIIINTSLIPDYLLDFKSNINSYNKYLIN
ncbi:hypothetical protein COW81_02410 [Candidatus Campbellbacteria bacterium CG22_combo_CG10-13_8_21_14_all_36_13]|uniref:Transposase IS200-like domain-containing protein n=1 Tax=Candidatus Campbellbacteria bacterium CG22_combo_CG10-13_8_21_14_all_36_13 TaxID=1974529 RepID=A0A2H0DXW2_9BACT|nr:MAG: hypothetical protein COW81_02410 [Candidatus Campbellbacteria bacterium CG22_combo_CG10-13_8_21_14_all_36_13]